EENGFGEILSVDDLKNHKWEMMDHDHDHHDHDHGFHTEGFDMHFTALDNVAALEEIVLEVSLTLHETPLEDAKVRFEIWKEEEKDQTDWVDAKETTAGSYVSDYVFQDAGTYHVQVHVEDDADLHKHVTMEVTVRE